jgi:hypothetical protein
VNYTSNLAMLLPRPFRRGEGRGEGLRVVYPTAHPLNATAGLSVIAFLMATVASPARDSTNAIAKGIPIQTVHGAPISNAGQSGGSLISNPPVGMTFITNVDQLNPPAQGATAAPEIKNGFSVIGFEKLASFPMTGSSLAPKPPGSPSNSKPSDQIPKEVKALDGHELAVRGFMLPMKGAGGLCSEFLLLRNRSACCYGVMPRLNEWIVVSMPGNGVKPIMDQPITISGKLHVGEVYKYDRLVGIYQMEGERMDGR